MASVAQKRANLLRHAVSQAKKCTETHSYGRALANYCVVFKLRPALKQDMKAGFLLALAKHTENLEQQQKWQELLDCYEQLLEIYPECEELHHSLGSFLFRMGYEESGTSSIRKALEINPNFTTAQQSLESIKTVILERWHFLMLNDTTRNAAFQKAISEAVGKGHKTVLDIGAGTGLLSLFALSAGAENVYSCEMSTPLCKVAGQVFKENGFGEKAVLIKKHSRDIVIPNDINERVSLVITETFDSALFGEHVLYTLQHAWKYLLQEQLQHKSESSLNVSEPSSLVIPQSASVFATVVECPWIREESRVHPKVLDVLGLEGFSVIYKDLEEDPYTTERLSCVREGFRMLSQAYKILSVDFLDADLIDQLIEGVTEEHKFACHSSGTFDAVAVWFSLDVGNTILSTSPEDKSCWEQAIFHVPFPLYGLNNKVNAGTSVTLQVSCKGHLSIECSEITNGGEKEPLQKEIWRIPRDLIRSVNSLHSANIARELAESIFTENSGLTVCDISGFPVLGLLALKSGCTVYVVSDEDMQHVVTSIASFYHKEENLKFISLEEMFSTKIPINVLVADPVDHSGLLKNRILEDIAMIKMLCMETSGILLPSHLSVYGMLIESNELLEQAYLVSNERTMGFKVAEFINKYQVFTHQDINLATLTYQPLSEQGKLADISLQDVCSNLDVSFSVPIKVTTSGSIAAIPYWFKIYYTSEHILDTLSHFLQAAVILPSPVIVKAGETVKLNFVCKNSTINMEISKDVSHN